MPISLNPSFAADISVNIILDVEDPNSPGTWLEYPASIARLTGESANYRLYFTISSLQVGNFENLQLKIAFPDAYGNFMSASNFALPTSIANVSFTTSTDTDPTFTLSANFLQAVPPGQTGYLQFTLNSRYDRGPDGYTSTPTATLVGSFVETATGESTPVNVQSAGPSWVVSCENMHSPAKSVTLNGGIYTEDADAYIVEYAMIDNFNAGATIPGSWGYTSAYVLDRLPNISGLDPVVVWSNNQNYTYDAVTKAIRWESALVSAPLTPLRVRIQYPKSQVDALGGIAAVGALSNTLEAHYLLIGAGDEAKTAPASLTLAPIPAKVYGTVSASKTNPAASGNVISGQVLTHQDMTYSFRISAGPAGNASATYVPDSIQVTDTGLSFVLEDGTAYAPSPDEALMTQVQFNTPGATIVVEYQTSASPGVFVAGGTVQGTDAYTFPALPAGEVVTAFRATATGLLYPNETLSVDVSFIFKQRSGAQPVLEHIVNSGSSLTTWGDGTAQGADFSYTLDLVYDKIITMSVVADAAPAPGQSISPGRELYITLDVASRAGTTYPLENGYVSMLAPNDFVPLHPELFATIIDNYTEDRQTLLQYYVENTFAVATWDAYHIANVFAFRIGPVAELTTYSFPTWWTMTPAQSNDPDIQLIIYGTSLMDIYDFEQNGPPPREVSGVDLPVTLVAGDIVNVAKMSKGPRDPEWHVQNHTELTRGELFQYQVFVRNDSNDPMIDVLMIDILPFDGDSRGSQWRPLLDAPIDGASADGATVYYSTSADPDMRPIAQTGTGTWSTTPPDDITAVRSIKISFGDRIFQPGESATVFLSMRASEAAVADGSLAYNNVNYIASSYVDGVITPYLAAFSPVVDALVEYRVFDTALGDFVWLDQNRNGIQDPGEPGLNGIRVELYNTDGILVNYTVSGNNPATGAPGYYQFSSVWPETYSVRFEPEPFSGYALTIQHAGDDPALDSDPEPATGLTDPIRIAADEVRTDIDAGYVRAEPAPCQDQLCQALTDLIESVAMEQAALAHILNAEGEKLQAFLKLPGMTPKALQEANTSVKRTVDAIAQLEQVLHSKLGLI